jgi:hypothetical protein
MKTFIFTYYTSTEPLAKIKAEDLEEAILKAAEIKKLPIEEFIQIFKVKEYDEKKNTKNRGINGGQNGGKEKI